MTALLSLAVVMVRTYGEFDSSFSVGFAVGDGLVFSSLWPLVGADSVFVLLKDKRLKVTEVQALDLKTGFCILKVKGLPAEKLPPIGKPRIGQRVGVLGIPWDQEKMSDLSLTLLGKYEFGEWEAFCVDTVMTLNRDGAPVLDEGGNLVGIVGTALGAARAIFGPEPVTELLPETTGTPIPIERVVDSLKNTPYWHLIAGLSVEDSERALEEFCKAEPLPAAFLYQATTLLSKRKLRAALVKFKAALRLRPQWPEALYGAGTILEILKDYREAIRKLGECFRLCPRPAVREALEEVRARLREDTTR